MGTKDFNIIDNIIAYLRLKQITKYLRKDSIVLDFGCGSQAYFLRYAKNKIKEGVGIDYDVRTTKISPNIKLIKYKYVNRLPFPNNHFTQIYILAVLEHLELDRINKIFKEFKRILKKDGKIILTTPTPISQPLLEFLAFQIHLISEEEIGDHKKYYEKQGIIKIAKKNGLIFEKYETFQLGFNSYAILKK